MISIVIPSYQRATSMLALLADLAAQDHADFEVIVVDDHSTDDSVARIRAAFPAVQVLVNPANCGPAVSRNRGIRAARGDLIVGFDSDVRVPDLHFLQRVETTFARHPAAAGLACRLLTADAGPDDARRWWHPLPLAANADRAFLTSYFSGTAYAFRRPAVLAAGLFPEDLFMHYEEVELAYQLLDAGYSLLYEPTLVVVHHEGRVSRRGQVHTFFKPRNQVLLAAKFFSWPAALWYLTPRLAHHFVSAARHHHLRDYARALTSALRQLPARLRQRSPLQRATRGRIAALHRGVYV